MKKHIFVSFLFLLIAWVLTTIFFNNIGNNKFLYIGDQFFRFTYFEAFINSFFIRKLENLSVLNGWQFITQFWDALYYLLIYKLRLSMIWAEKLLFFIVLFLSLYLSFAGFKKLSLLITNKQNILIIFVITLYYCFNPYAVSLWHGGVYNLGSGLTYSLAPLILYYFHTSVFLQSSLRNKVICVLLMAVAAFTFWLYAPFLFFLICYSFIYLLFHLRSIRVFLKNILILLLLYVPLISFILFNILYEYFRNVGSNNSTFMPTFGNEQGGIWYQALMLFSWGIYTVWTPRSMYSFHAYYFSKAYIIPTAMLYLLIIGGSVKYIFTKKLWKIGKYFVIFLLILLFSLFLAKAAQPPHGEIFLYLYDHVPFFSVFRTADIRFGFTVVLSISLLLLLTAQAINKYVLSIAILIILGYQSHFFFKGIAIQGENVKKLFYDRVIYYPKEYTDVIQFLNKDKSIATYILPLPAVEYGHYVFDTGEHHFGQDILSKLVQKQFVYLSLSNGAYTKSYKELKSIIEKKEFTKLSNFPIKYLLIRKDIFCPECLTLSEKEVGKTFKKVYKNKLFTVYELKDYPPVVKAPDISFSVINPVKYRVQLHNVSKKQSLQFLESFHNDWKLYLAKSSANEHCLAEKVYKSLNSRECVKAITLFQGEELSYLWEKSLFEDTHQLAANYGNQWEINPKTIMDNYSSAYYTKNKDGSINFDMVVYYQPQSWFYLTLFISIISLFVSILYLVRKINKS